MNVLLVSIDSLRWDFLSTYRERPQRFDYAMVTPNLDRFAERSTAFDRRCAWGLFCMPARREWQTGVREFLWRTWGPVERLDVALPRLARGENVPAALVTDHYHYFRHGSRAYYEGMSNSRQTESLLFDVTTDERQRNDLADADSDAGRRMAESLVEAFDSLDAPDREYERFGLDSA